MAQQMVMTVVLQWEEALQMAYLVMFVACSMISCCVPT